MINIFKKLLNSDIKSLEKNRKKLNSLRSQFSVLSSFTDAQLDECVKLYFQFCFSNQDNPAKEHNPQVFQYANVKANIKDKYFALMLAEQCCIRRYHQPYEIQMVAAMLILDNHAVQMNTGEGKTLVIMMAAFARALSGHTVKVVTSNDYLAQRDSTLYNKVFPYQETQAVFNKPAQSKADKNNKIIIHNPEQYKVMYSSPTELAFDYLRANGAYTEQDFYARSIQQWHWFDCVIIDEADAVLIDQAAQEHILSEEDSTDSLLYESDKATLKLVEMFFKSGSLIESKYDQETGMSKMAQMERLANATPEYLEHLQKMKEESGDYYFDKDKRNINLFESALDKLDQWAAEQGLDNGQPFHLHAEYPHFLKTLSNRLIAEHGLISGEDYLVRDGIAYIIDRNTGRTMPHSRWKDGIHQAVEIKEGIEVQPDTRTCDAIEYQTFFNLFPNRAGLSGTLADESMEMQSVYGMHTVVLPPNKPMVRIDRAPVLFFNKEAKYAFLGRALKKQHERGRPVLVCAPSVDIADEIEQVLLQAQLPFKRLDAKNHQYEAEIIAEAGHKGRITLASNMAGRGTDIQLGAGVEELGGLLVVSVEYGLSRRADAQMRGRAGRQGEPGETWLLASFEDMLIQKFVPKDKAEYVHKIYLRMAGFDEHSNPIDADGLWNKLFNTTQQAIESADRTGRKRLTDTGSLLQKQREVNYGQRAEVRQTTADAINERLHEYIELYAHKAFPIADDEEDYSGSLKKYLDTVKEARYQPYCSEYAQNCSVETEAAFLKAVCDIWKIRTDSFYILEGSDFIAEVLRYKRLQQLKIDWQVHLDALQNFKKAAAFSKFSGKQPINEFKQRSDAHFMQQQCDTEMFYGMTAVETDWEKTYYQIDSLTGTNISIVRETFLNAADEKRFSDKN